MRFLLEAAWKIAALICMIMQTVKQTECYNPYNPNRPFDTRWDHSTQPIGSPNYHSAGISDNQNSFDGHHLSVGSKIHTTNRPKRSFGVLERILGGGGGYTSGGGYASGGYYPTYSRGHSLGGLLTPFYNKLAYSNPYLYSRYRYYGPGIYSSLFASRGYGFH